MLTPMKTTNLNRRHWLSHLALSGLAFAALPAALAEERVDNGPGRAVSLGDLQTMLTPHFPLGYQVPGFLSWRIEAPDLGLLPSENRLRARMALLAEGAALNRQQTGSLDVDFGLRFEPRDRTVRTRALRVGRVSFPGLRPEAQQMIQIYGPALAEAALQDAVLHQLQEKDLSMLHTLGLRPGPITVTATGLFIGFEPRPL